MPVDDLADGRAGGGFVDEVLAVSNIAIQALIAAYAGRKAIVDQASARTAVTEVTSD